LEEVKFTEQELAELSGESIEDDEPAMQPGEVEITEVMELVDARSITVSPGEIRFEKAGMEITLDGIAKGYIVDAIGRVLERQGVRRYLINAGGDIRSAGGKEQALPWSVAVQSPTRDGCFPDTIHLTDGAVAQVGNQRSEDAAKIDTVMLKKSVILSSQHRQHEVFGNLLDRDQMPAFALRTKKLHDFLWFQFKDRNRITVINSG